MPFVKGTSDYSAYFAEAGGIKPGSDVRVSGMSVGRVSDVTWRARRCWWTSPFDDGVELGDRTEAAIKTETVLGTKMLEITPRGDGALTGTIPLERTTSPYDLPTALGDLTTTISGLDTTQLSSALTTLADTFKDTPPDLKLALEGVARFSETLNTRDAQLRNLLADANKVTAVLAKRSDQIASLVVNTNALLSEVLSQRDSDRCADEQPHRGVTADLRAGGRQPHPAQAALDKLNGVLGSWTTANRNCSACCHLLRRYAMSFGEVLGAGAVLQGLRGEPAARPVRAAVHRRRVLRSGPGPQRAAAVGACRPRSRPARHPGTAGARSRAQARAANRI